MPDAKYYISYDSIYMKYAEKANFQKHNVDSGQLRLWGGSGFLAANRHKWTFQSGRNILKLLW